MSDATRADEIAEQWCDRKGIPEKTAIAALLVAYAAEQTAAKDAEIVETRAVLAPFANRNNDPPQTLADIARVADVSHKAWFDAYERAAADAKHVNRENRELAARADREAMKAEQYKRQLDDRWAGVVETTNKIVGENKALKEALAEVTEQLHLAAHYPIGSLWRECEDSPFCRHVRSLLADPSPTTP